MLVWDLDRTRVKIRWERKDSWLLGQSNRSTRKEKRAVHGTDHVINPSQGCANEPDLTDVDLLRLCSKIEL